MDFRKTKNFLHRTCVTGLVALMLTSCITNKPIEVAEATPSAEAAATAAEMPKTTNDVQPNVTAADEATWAEIEERQRQQELIRQALEEAARLEAERIEKERLEAERLEAERLEAERLEAERLAEEQRLEQERLEAERIEAERLEAERLAEEQRLAEQAALEAQEEENPLAYILDETVMEPETGWTIKPEDASVYVPSATTDVEITERSTESDRILSGENGNNMPSWLMSPKEQEEVSLGSSLQVVNVYQPLEQEKEESEVTADDILAFGSVYTADRESKVPVKNMDKEQIVAKLVELSIKGIPYAIIAAALIVSILLLKFLKKKINPMRKRKIKEQEGVEVVADGFMVARPGQGTDPGPLEMSDEDEQETTKAQDKAPVSGPEPEPVKEDKPATDPRVIRDEDYEDNSPMFNIKAPWKPVNRAAENKSQQNDPHDGTYKEVSDEDLTFLVPD